MKKRILVIYYSQSGQLKDIMHNMLLPMDQLAEYDIDYYAIEPQKQFNFPWKGKDFYNAFPESFQQIPVDIFPPPNAVLEQKYDLVFLAYQIWFLTPSIPINSFLKSPYAQQLLNGKKVITVIGCRNMWAKAQSKTKALIQSNGGTLVANIAFADRHLNHISVITIVHWVMGGKKTKKWNIFPKPGVSDEDILGAKKFGQLIDISIKTNDFENLQTKIIENDGSNLKPFIVFMDEKANKMFSMWSNFVLKSQHNRQFRISLFKIYLLVAIWLISPIVNLLFILTYPLRLKQIKQKKSHYCGVKG